MIAGGTRCSGTRTTARQWIRRASPSIEPAFTGPDLPATEQFDRGEFGAFYELCCTIGGHDDLSPRQERLEPPWPDELDTDTCAHVKPFWVTRLAFDCQYLACAAQPVCKVDDLPNS